MACSIAYDSSTAFRGCQEQKTSSSSRLSSLMNVSRGNLDEWFGPATLAFITLKEVEIKCKRWRASDVYTSKRLHLSPCSGLHYCLDHFMRTSTDGLYAISIGRTLHSIQWPSAFPFDLPFKLLHPLWKSCLLIVGSFPWLLRIWQNLQKNVFFF